MTTRVSDYTLEHFAARLTDRHPMPAGVASRRRLGSLALGLLAKVLAVTGRRKSAAG